MAIQIEDLDTLIAKVLGYFRAPLPSQDTGPDSWIGKQGRAIALALWGLKNTVSDVDTDASPSQSNSDAKADDWAFIFGVPNGAGGFGRRASTYATGAQVLLTGTPGVIFPDQMIALAPDGKTQFKLSGAQTIPGGGSIAGSFVASTPGTDGNLPVGTKLAFQSPPAGGASSAALTSASAGGLDRETTATLLARIFARLQNPPGGGNAIEWSNWGANPFDPNGIPILGIARCYVYPRHEGTGTVANVLDAGGTGTARMPGDALLTAVKTYLAAIHPVTAAGSFALKPYMPDANALTIRTRVIAADGFVFDWRSNTLGLTVAGYSGAGPITLTLSAVAPADLLAAIAAGSHPRIQVFSTGGSPLGEQVKINSIDGTHLILTLANAPATAPTVGDHLYAGGPIPSLVAPLQAAYVDSLGPSRIAGFNDGAVAWDDLVATERLAAIAISTLSSTTNGSRVVTNIVKIGGISQVTIAVGVGAPTTNDYQPGDTFTNPPELARALFIVVTD